MAALLLGITLIFWAIIGLGWLAASMTIVYVLALITGILWVLGGWVELPALPARRRPEA